MKTLLKLMIILALFKNIYPEGCRTTTGKLVCQNVALKQGNPLEISDYNEVWSIDFDFSTIKIIPTEVFHNFHNVTVIWLDNSEVRILEPGAFNGMKKLQVLHLENNAIMEIQPGVFDGLENLQSINLDENHLLKVNKYYFTNLPSLITLRLEHNNIKLLNENVFENIPKLENLWLRHNAITKLEKNSFGKLKNLIVLDLAYNFLTNIDCESFQNLTQLYLDHNNLTTISENCFKGLKKLYLNNNKFKKINPSWNISNLKLNNNMWGCNSLLKTVQVLKNFNVTIEDANITNTTNVYGIICKWNDEDLENENQGHVSLDESSSITEIYTEISENIFSDFTTNSNPKILVSPWFYKKCSTFSRNIIIILGVMACVCVIMIIVNLFVMRYWAQRYQKSYKVKKEIAMLEM